MGEGRWGRPAPSLHNFLTSIFNGLANARPKWTKIIPLPPGRLGEMDVTLGEERCVLSGWVF